MQTDVKSRSRRRRVAAVEATQREIVEAAGQLFRDRGYTATTMEELASAAGVAVQTVYNSIGGKRAVLNRVLDFAAAGPQAPTSVPEFMRQRTEAAASPQAIVEILADWFVEVTERTAHITRVIRDAAAGDPEIADLERRRDEQRFRNYHEAARAIGSRGGLARLGEPEAAAGIWAIGHPNVHRLLVVEQGWSRERYRAWLVEALSRLLLGRPARG